MTPSGIRTGSRVKITKDGPKCHRNRTGTVEAMYAADRIITSDPAKAAYFDVKFDGIVDNGGAFSRRAAMLEARVLETL